MAMQRRTLLNLGMLVLVIALTLIAVYQPGLKKPAPPVHLTHLDRAAIRHIRIVDDGKPPIELALQQGRWMMTKPVRVAANPVHVDALLDLSQRTSLAQHPVAKEDLGKYELSEPRVKLFLNDTELDFGNDTPLDHRRYVRVGDTVHLIRDTFAYYQLTGGFTNFISNALLDADTKFEALALPGLNLKLTDGRWQATPPPPHDSPDRITQLLDTWRHSQAINIRPYQPKPGGTPITLTLKGGKQVVFILVARKPDLILARPDLGVAYHLPQSAAKDLFTLQPLPKAKTPPTPGA